MLRNTRSNDGPIVGVFSVGEERLRSLVYLLNPGDAQLQLAMPLGHTPAGFNLAEKGHEKTYSVL